MCLCAYWFFAGCRGHRCRTRRRQRMVEKETLLKQETRDGRGGMYVREYVSSVLV